MKFSEYMEEAHKTAIYPNQTNNFGLAYLSLKLCGEANELYNACHSWSAWEVLQEAGDVLWYVSQIARTLKLDINFDLTDGVFRTPAKPADFLIMKSACLIAEHTGKIYRDAREDTIEVERQFFKVMIIDILACLSDVVYGRYSSLNEIAQYNLDKLAGREKRGTLNGSGNNR